MKLVKHVHLFLSFLVTATLAVSANFAQASTFSYSLLGVTTSFGSVSGIVSIDSATDRITAANITFNNALVGNPMFTNIGSPNAYNGLGQDYISGLSNSPLNYGGQMALYYDTAKIGIGDLGICVAIGPCGTERNQASYVQIYTSGAYGGLLNVTGGSLQRVSSMVTPEPSSLVLLGSGILGFAVFARWKLHKI